MNIAWTTTRKFFNPYFLYVGTFGTGGNSEKMVPVKEFKITWFATIIPDVIQLCFLKALRAFFYFSNYFRVMESAMFAPFKKLKIFNPVVAFISVFVVNNFVRKEKPADSFFHYKNENIAYMEGI